VDQAILAVPGVKGVHDLHVWSISSSDLALSAHVVVADASLSELGAVMTGLKDMLARQFGVGHVTVELEDEGGQCAGSSCDLAPVGLRPGGGHQGLPHP
jgi:cobalt-zinc-cadmium efflux system protein